MTLIIPPPSIIPCHLPLAWVDLHGVTPGPQGIKVIIIVEHNLTAPQFQISQLAPGGGLTNSPTKSAAEENDGVDSRAWMANPRNA